MTLDGRTDKVRIHNRDPLSDRIMGTGRHEAYGRYRGGRFAYQKIQFITKVAGKMAITSGMARSHPKTTFQSTGKATQRKDRERTSVNAHDPVAANMEVKQRTLLPRNQANFHQDELPRKKSFTPLPRKKATVCTVSFQ